MEVEREAEVARNESDQEVMGGSEEKDIDLCQSTEKDNDMVPNNHEVLPSHFRSSTKNQQLPRRDIRTLNYAFGKPKVDEAAKEAQDWLDGLSIAEEEENNPKTNIFPHGLKYRSALANLSPQMLDRLQRCEENQEPCEPPKNARIRCGDRNSSVDVHAGLHHEDHTDGPKNAWKGRRSAACNSSSSVYAILHPQAEVRCKRKKSPKKKPIIKRNHLKGHLAAIAEMSSLTHGYKENERKQEAERLSAIKHWGNTELPKKTLKRQRNRSHTNFVEKNMENVTEQSACVRALREDPRPDALSPHKENIGRVPEYLQRIKSELAQEAENRTQPIHEFSRSLFHKAEHCRVIEEAAKSFPAGRRLMSDVNRRHILQKLENKHKELIDTLKSFPLMFDTPRQIRLKSNVEQQLRNIEASHSYYDNPKVYTSCLDVNCPTCMCVDYHFFQDSQRKMPNSHDDDVWEHMACGAGIQTSPKRNTSRETGGNFRGRGGGLESTSPARKRRSQDGEFYVSPSKRHNTSPQKLVRQSTSACGVCKKCSATGQTPALAKHSARNGLLRLSSVRTT